MKRAMLCLLVATSACKSETGTVLQIVDSPAFNDDCSISATPTLFQSRGLYDPTGLGNYTLTLLLQNNANIDENPAAIPGDTNVKPSANDVTLVGFDFCLWSSEEASVNAYDTKAKGFPVDCDDVPDTLRGFVLSGGGVAAGGGLRSTGVDVIELSHLRALFGASFDPDGIADALDDPRNVATRSPAWGDFPAELSARTNINVRARAQSQSGATVRSNWFTFPVEICPRCVSDLCRVFQVRCPDGSSGLQGRQPADGACPQRFSGADFACEDVDTCS